MGSSETGLIFLLQCRIFAVLYVATHYDDFILCGFEA